MSEVLRGHIQDFGFKHAEIARRAPNAVVLADPCQSIYETHGGDRNASEASVAAGGECRPRIPFPIARAGFCRPPASFGEGQGLGEGEGFGGGLGGGRAFPANCFVACPSDHECPGGVRAVCSQAVLETRESVRC